MCLACFKQIICGNITHTSRSIFFLKREVTKQWKLKKFACLSLDIKTGSKLPHTNAFVSLLFNLNSYNPFTRNCSYKTHLTSQNHVLRFLPEEILLYIMKTRLYLKKNKLGL